MTPFARRCLALLIITGMRCLAVLMMAGVIAYGMLIVADFLTAWRAPVRDTARQADRCVHDAHRLLGSDEARMNALVKCALEFPGEVPLELLFKSEIPPPFR